MADFIAFNEGRQEVETQGWPATVSFDLSTTQLSSFTAATTFAGGYGKLTSGTSTGYALKTSARPTATGLGVEAFTLMSWSTGAATNWPTTVYTIVAFNATTSKIICAWNLVIGGAARDMSAASTTLNVTPTYDPTNPP